MADEFLNSEISLFYQREPTGSMTYLNEVALTDIRLSGLEAGAPYDSPYPGVRGTFKIKGHFPGTPISAGFTCQRPWQEINYLWSFSKEGKMNFRANAAKTGTENDVENYSSALIFTESEVTNPTLDGGKALQSGDVSRNLTSMQIQAVNGFELLPLGNASRLTTTESEDANGIFFADAVKEGTLRRRTGEHGVIAQVAPGAGSSAQLIRTIDYGGTWTAGTADPFAPGEDCIDPLILDLPQTDQYRVITFCNTTAAGTASRCSYTDVTPKTAAWGTTWSSVDVGTTNAYFITAAFKVHDGLILAGDDQGNVYYSKDKGASWTAASYGGSNDVRAFDIAPDDTLWAGGDGTEVYYSEDDGATWSAVTTAPAGAVTGLAVNYEGYVFIIDGTTLKYSPDEGLSWTSVTVTSEAVTALKDIKFDPENRYIGFILVDDAGADDRLFRSEDGGMSWIAQTTGTSNTGYNVQHVCSPNLTYIAGDVVTTTWIEKVFGAGQGS
jgi:photosystem II stability/assembly factor-like uncharacterized protein